jgi:hypothetical protein
MGEMRSAYTILARNPERKIALGKLDLLNWVSGKIKFKDLDLIENIQEGKGGGGVQWLVLLKKVLSF